MKKIVSFVSLWMFLFSLANAQNKVKITMDNGASDIYSSSLVESIDFSNENDFSITLKNGDEKKSYNGNVTQISFIKQTTKREGGVEIISAEGWFESGYVVWIPFADASSYSVYYKELGGKLITIGTDAHSADMVGKGIEQGIEVAKSAGFTHYAIFEKHSPILIEI